MAMLGPTTDHDTIRQWAAVNGAVPVEVAITLFDGEPTKLGFIFTKGRKSAPEFKPISWDAFFALFDVLGLSLVYEETRPDSYELLQMDGREQSGFSVGPS